MGFCKSNTSSHKSSQTLAVSNSESTNSSSPPSAAPGATTTTSPDDDARDHHQQTSPSRIRTFFLPRLPTVDSSWGGSMSSSLSLPSRSPNQLNKKALNIINKSLDIIRNRRRASTGGNPTKLPEAHHHHHRTTTTTTNNSSNKTSIQTKKKKKEVKFVHVSKNEIYTASPRICMTQLEIENCWWTKDDREKTMIDINYILQNYINECIIMEQTNTHKNFLQLISFCQEWEATTTTEDDILPCLLLGEEEEENIEEYSDDSATTTTKASTTNAFKRTMGTVTCLVPRSISTSMSTLSTRGLELDLVPMLRSIQKNHIEQVLECANSHSSSSSSSSSSLNWKKNKKKNHHHDDLELKKTKEQIISSRSIELSRPFRILARIIGQADEEEGKNN